MFQQVLCKIQQVVVQGHVGHGGMGLQALAGFDQHGPAAGGLRRLHVSCGIADKKGCGRVEPPFRPGLMDQSRLGLAAVALFVGGMIADEKIVDGAVNSLSQRVMDRIQLRAADLTTANAGLVGDNQQGVTGIVQQAKRPQA